jgi:hypothetical protein
MSTERRAALLAVGGMLLVGVVLWAVLLPETTSAPMVMFSNADRAQHRVALDAAMHDPIDWAHPLAISTLRYPFGTSLLLADALPLLGLPLRLAWQSGLLFDPMLALDLYRSAMLVIAPLSVYLLARTLGGSRLAASSSGLLVVGIAPLLQYPLFSEGLASWPIFTLLLVQLVRSERGAKGLEGAAALLAALLWWAHPSNGILGLAFSSAYALGALPHRSARRLLPLLGSLVGLAAVWQASIPIPPGMTLEMPSGLGSSAVPGLLSARFDTWSEITAQTWGVLALVCSLLAQPRLWRIVPRLALATLGLAVISLGAIGNYGLIPIELIDVTPLRNIDSFDRLFLPAALFGVALVPAVFEATLERLARRLSFRPLALRLQLPALAIAALIAFYGGASNGLTPIWEVEHSDRSVVPAMPFVRELVRGHDRLLFLPDFECESFRAYTDAYDPKSNPDGSSSYDTAGPEAMAQEMGYVWIAATEGLPAYGFYTARMIQDAERMRSGVDCAHTGELPPPGTLVVASTLFETDPAYVAPWEAIAGEMAACSNKVTIGLIRDVRFCSDRPSLIDAFEANLAALGGTIAP